MANPTFDRPIENACPHDGFYNGNPILMIRNGTYADYRFRIVEWVRKGKMQEQQLARWDAEWEKIPLDEKIKRRNKVIEDSTPKPKRYRNGKIEMEAQPSDNGSAVVRDAQFRKPLKAKTAFGSLAMRPDPFANAVQSQPAPSTGAAVPGFNPNPPQSPESIPPTNPVKVRKSALAAV